MRRIITLLIIAVFMTGCASADKSKRSITLNKATRIYDNAIRWGDYDIAGSLRKQPAPAAGSALLKRIKVTSLTPVSVTVSDDQSLVQRAVEIRYYNEDRMKVITLVDHQTWEYDSDEKTWYLITPLPAFR